MARLLCIVLLLCTGLGAYAQGSFATADTLGMGVLKTGNVSTATPDHYYKVVIPANGIVRLLCTTTNTGTNTGYVRYYAYYKNQNSIGYKEVARNAGATGNDTLTLGGVAADTIYFRVWNYAGGQPFVYSISFDMLNVSPNSETQPNETIATAQLLPINTNVNGHLSFTTTAGPDVNDYYKMVLPKQGTLRLYVTATNLSVTFNPAPMPRIHLLNKSGGGENLQHTSSATNTFQLIANQGSTQLQATFSDTLRSFARADDTMYVYLNNYHAGLGWPFSTAYTLRWEIADTATTYNEQEPNSTMTNAATLPQGATVNGTISYRNNNLADVDDYHRVILPKSGTMNIYVTATNTNGFDATNAAPIVFVYNKINGVLNVRSATGTVSSAMRVRNEGAVPFLSSLTDTMRVGGMANDTFYIRVNNYHYGLGIPYASHYSLRYQMTDTVTNETEPNNSFAQAQLLAEGQEISGHVTHANATSNDIEDYIKIVKPVKGSIRIYVTSKNTHAVLNAAPALEVFAYTELGGNLTIKSATGAVSGNGLHLRNNGSVPLDGLVTDTMLVECVADDTMYLRVENFFNFQFGGNATTYKLRYEYVPVPEATIAYSRTGNEFGFDNQATNATSYLWLMGNGNQHSTYYPPMTSYVPGFYTVKLVAQYNTCNYKDTAQVSFTVAGVEYYTPRKAGAGGDAIVQIYGGGLDTATKLKLIKGAVTLQPREKYTNTKLNHLTAVMDLHFADTGWYDVVIEVPGQATVTYTNGFHIEALQYPFAWSQVVGPAAWRTNTDNMFKLTVGNRGNVTASGVVVAMVWPKSTTVTWKAREYKPDYTKNDTLIDGPKTYIFPNEMYRCIYDSVTTTVPIDSFEGQPFDGYIRYFMIPHIPAHGSVELPFTARATTPGAQRFITYTHRPNMLGSCPTGNYEDYGNDLTGEFIDAADMIADKTKIPAFTAFTKSAKIGQKHMQSAASYVGKEFWAWYDGYETNHEQNMTDWIRETDANNEFALKTAAQELIGAGINTGIANRQALLNNRVDYMNKILANNPNMSAKNFENAMDFLNGAGAGLSRLEKMKALLEVTKGMGDLSEKLLTLQQLANDCPELQPQVDELKKQLQDDLTHFDRQPTPTNSVNSFDPNAIYGPSGMGTPRYISNFKRQPFLITFENVDTASADAQDVTMRDTIDKTKFDISSFEFGDVVVANQIVRVPRGRQQFVVQSRLDSIPGMYVRVIGIADTAAGVISWHFSSIDSASMNRPALHGFLPPNVSKPEGEGSVSYMIDPRTTVPDASIFSSKATIIFDENAPIETAPWSNQLDIGNPTSLIASGTLTDDTVITLQMSGTDASSGVGSYTVFVATNGGPWQVLGRTNTETMTVIGEHDSTYTFYAVATDNVGNTETKIPVVEYTITIPTDVRSVKATGATCVVYPNPASQEVFIDVELTKEEYADVVLQTITGQVVMNLYSGRLAAGKTVLSARLQQVPAGVYFVVLTTRTGLRQTAKLVVTQ